MHVPPGGRRQRPGCSGGPRQPPGGTCRPRKGVLWGCDAAGHERACIRHVVRPQHGGIPGNRCDAFDGAGTGADRSSGGLRRGSGCGRGGARVPFLSVCAYKRGADTLHGGFTWN